jgi:hypothetical protein
MSVSNCLIHLYIHITDRLKACSGLIPPCSVPACTWSSFLVVFQNLLRAGLQYSILSARASNTSLYHVIFWKLGKISKSSCVCSFLCLLIVAVRFICACVACSFVRPGTHFRCLQHFLQLPAHIAATRVTMDVMIYVYNRLVLASFVGWCHVG